MRLWSLHPRLLDRAGLGACWNEAALARRVLLGQTRGYRHHPQLARFRAAPVPLAALAVYMAFVHAEATRRGYRYNPALIPAADGFAGQIPVTAGQVAHEWQHLLAKLQRRNPAAHRRALACGPELHPMFYLIPGPVEVWERA